MGLFSDMDTAGHEENKDVLGGYSPLETDIYTGPIKLAYAGQSDGGARNVTLVLDIGGREYTETVYYTNRQGQNFYEKDGSKRSLPGFIIIDDLCMVTTEKPLKDQDTEEKTVKIYDYDKREEVPTAVHVLVDLIGKEASFAIQKNLENKSKKEGNEYVDTADTRETNNIQKVFHKETRMTVPEARNGSDTAEFYDAWLSKNKGVTRDKRTVKGNASQAGAPGGGGVPEGGQATERKSLFGNKG